MKRLIIILCIILLSFTAIVLLRQNPLITNLLWDISNRGAWLLPLVLVSSLLDSVHPCSFSILLITIAFLFSMQMNRKKIIQIGAIYIGGIFVAYLSIGLGILKALHLFNTPHFMGKLGSLILIIFGLINIINYLFPSFPIKLKLPSATYKIMGNLMEKTSVLATFGLGLLVGLCQFPCMGGPYLMIIGLLRDQATYFTGFGYLLLYNVILTLPLLVVLFISSDSKLIEKVQEWKTTNLGGFKLWAGIIMILLGLVILYI